MHFRRVAMTLVTGVVVAVPCELACAQSTERVSVDSAGTQGNSGSYIASISADGRFVAYWSNASNLVSGDTNGILDVFVHDRQTGTTERASVDSAGIQGNSVSGPYSSVSGDGRFVAFESYASNLVSGDTNGTADVLVRDRQSGTTERVSVDSAGAQGNGFSDEPSISADGRFVAFASAASNLTSGDRGGYEDVFVHDRQTGTTEIVTVSSTGTQAFGGHSGHPWISVDGRYVAFESDAYNLVPGDTNGRSDIFVHDRQTGTTERISVDSAGTQGDDSSYSGSISADGRLVAFESNASNLVSNDTNGCADIFVHDRQAGTTVRVSIDSAGIQGDLGSAYASISADGRFVAFDSDATNLVSGDTNAGGDVFVHGPYLTLEANLPAPQSGATLTFTTWTGAANGLTLLVLTNLNGTPTFLPLDFSSFDVIGRWTLSGTVPPGLSGTVMTFEMFGFVPTGKVDESNSFAVSFQ